MSASNRFLKRAVVAVTIVSAGLALGACQTAGPNQTAGTLLGAAGGGFMGSRIGGGSGRLAATALGTLVGAGIGSSVGKSLDHGRAYAPPPRRDRVVRHYHYHEEPRRYRRHHRHRHWHW